MIHDIISVLFITCYLCLYIFIGDENAHRIKHKVKKKKSKEKGNY